MLAAEARQHAWRRRRSLLLRFALLAAVVWFAWYQWYPDSTPVPLPASATRGVVGATIDPLRWPLPDGDVARTRSTAARPNLNAAEAWRIRLGSLATTGLVATADAIYVGVSEGAVLALSTRDGHELWRVPVAGQIDAAPALAGDRLYVGLRDGSLAAIDARDGRQVWRAGRGASVFTSPVVDAGVVYVTSGRGDVRAFDAEDGRQLWERAPKEALGSAVPLAIGAGVLAVVAGDEVDLIDRMTGQETYFYRMRAPVAALAHDREVIALGRQSLTAFGVEQRRPWWEPARMWWGQFWLQGLLPAPPGQPSRWVAGAPAGGIAPAIAGELLIVAATGGAVRAHDLRTGEERWSASVGRLVFPPVATAAGVLLLEADALVWLDAATGVVRGRQPLPGERFSSVAVTDGGSYLLSRGSDIVALR